MKQRLASHLGRDVLTYKVYGSDVVAILDNHQKVRLAIDELQPPEEPEPDRDEGDEPEPGQSADPDQKRATDAPTITPDTPISQLVDNNDLLTRLDDAGIFVVADLADRAQMLPRKHLRPLAAALGIEGARDMNKRPLVKAIKEFVEGHQEN